MALKLYGAPMSVCTSRVLTCLHEKNLDFELVPVELFAGESKQPPFIAKKAFGQFPVLEDDDLVLFAPFFGESIDSLGMLGWTELTIKASTDTRPLYNSLTGKFDFFTESRAITSYVAQKFKETGYDLIRHKNLKEAALVKLWTEVESHQFHPAISPIFFQFFLAPLLGNLPDQTIIDTNLEKLGKVLDLYEARLTSSKYLAGDFYSLADLHHLPSTYYLMKTPAASVVNERPHVKAWWEDISSRPAFKNVTGGMNFGNK